MIRFVGQPIVTRDLVAPSAAPLRFRVALRALAASLDSALRRAGFVQAPRLAPGGVVAALATRDLLRHAGFSTAAATPAAAWLRAERSGAVLDEILYGDPEAGGLVGGTWGGHLVVVVPEIGMLVDPTFGEARRDHWPGLPRIAAAPLEGSCTERPFGLVPLARLEALGDGRHEGYAFRCRWLDDRENHDFLGDQEAKRIEDREAALEVLAGSFEAHLRVLVRDP
jgi:hypothetical protein